MNILADIYVFGVFLYAVTLVRFTPAWVRYTRRYYAERRT